VISLGLENSINYLLLGYNEKNPEPTRKAVFASLERLLLDRNLVEEFFGGYPRTDTKFKQQIDRFIPDCKRQFEDLVGSVASIYKKKLKYVYPALLYQNLLGDSVKSLDCLIEMRLGVLLEERNIGESERKDAGDLIAKLVRENRSKEQERLIGFIECYESMAEALADRNVTD